MIAYYAVLVSGALVLAACESQPPELTPAPAATTLPSAAVSGATPTGANPLPTRALGVAVAVGSPTPTPVLVGDYATLVRPRLERIQRGLANLNRQLTVLQTTPLRMADADWRTQTQDLLDELAAASLDVRSLAGRAGTQTTLNAQLTKLLDEVDFVASEYRMALDYDPDGTHFIRAGRVRRTATDEVAAILTQLAR